jgi:hypothetical protein
MEQASESLDLHYLVRGGLYRIVQLISRLDSISLESQSATGTALADTNLTNLTALTDLTDTDTDLSDPTPKSSDWKERASALTFCWTGRVIEWSGF